MSIGDVHSNERGTAARFNTGKPAFDLVPLSALADCARVFDYGRAKYAEWNWAKGQPWSVPFACLMRHMAAWQAGEDLDPESGLPHLGHAMANLVMLSTFARTYREGDDRTEWLRETKPVTAREAEAEIQRVGDKAYRLTGSAAEQAARALGVTPPSKLRDEADRAAYLARWANAPAEAKYLVQDPNGSCWFVDRKPYQRENNHWDGGNFFAATRGMLGRVACEPRPRAESEA
jgi:hypothetical protein